MPFGNHSSSPEIGTCPPRPWVARLALLICATMVAGMLAIGLSPFRRPKNEVTWLVTQDGLRFGSYATLLSSTPFSMGSLAEAGGEPACTIELFWQAGNSRESPTILAFSTAENPLQLSLLNYQSSALLQKGAGPGGRENIGVRDVFIRNRPVFLTLTSGARGSSIFVDGKLRGVFPEFHFGKDCQGRLVIGASPVAHFRCPGKLLGLAILTREIQDSEALRHYEIWAKERHSGIRLGKNMAALYLFNEREGNLVHNAVPGGVNLEIPYEFVLLHQPRLEPFWKEYKPGWSHWKDILVNLVGFMPLGLVFYACALSVWSLKRPVLASVALGLAVSLTIEVVQSFLPSRSSGTMDLITNTLGTYIGTRLHGLGMIRVFPDRVFQLSLTGNRLRQDSNG